MQIKSFLKDFLVPKFKFAITSGIATAADYGIYLVLTHLLLTSESISHAISYTVGMIINFFLQKRFIFLQKRKITYVFMLSIGFSMGGWVLSQAIFNGLIHSFSFFETYDLLAKIVVTGIIFFYNFYTKRFSFEKRYPMDKVKDYLKR